MAALSKSSYLLASVNSSQTQRTACSPLKNLYVPSKAAVLILLWTVIVGMMYHTVMTVSVVAVLNDPQPNTVLSSYDPVLYAIVAIIMIFHPLSGFIADVCCGRLKAVVVSLILLLICNIFALLGVSVLETIEHQNIYTILNNQGILAVFLGALSLLTFVVGLVGYQANFIQLGLDQLFEAPSHSLGLFIHYAIWDFKCIGSLVFTIAMTVYCIRIKKTTMEIPMLIASVLILVLLLLVSCWKRKWFHSEPGQTNPYKGVYNIIKYAKNNKYPVRRSAFTHCDNHIPSRLDFAKERYGGPFTTEQVENVKTLLRILLVLFAMGPVFSMEAASSVFIFPLTSLHVLHYKEHWLQCSIKEVWELYVAIGSIKNLMSTIILFPAYICVIFYLLHKKLPKLFTRLGIGIVTCLLGVFSLLIIDVVGHSMNGENVTNQTQCMFRTTLNSAHFSYATLNMHWSVLILPNLLLGIGPLIVVATAFEFISAQSPQSMKGLLVGVFFAIRGLFQLLNSTIIIPLSLKQPWASEEMIEHPPVTNCGFVYLLLTCVTGVIGLILFLLAAKRYKYRTRDEGMFRQQDVEEVYDRYLTQAALDNSSYESVS